MEINKILHQIEVINKLKLEKNFAEYDLKELRALPFYNGIYELIFEKIPFYMINLNNDDSIPLKYTWRNGYEEHSLKIWFKLSRTSNELLLDIGAHTGIYSIIALLNNVSHNVVSFEPYYLNFARLIDNLKINNKKTSMCFLAAVSDKNGNCKFKIDAPNYSKTQGGKISEDGQLLVPSVRIDDMKFTKKIRAIKIDTEGHEHPALEGSKQVIDNHRPEIIFEINKKSFDSVMFLLDNYKYEYFLIDEENKTLEKVSKIDQNLFDNKEGINCVATQNYKSLMDIIS